MLRSPAIKFGLAAIILVAIFAWPKSSFAQDLKFNDKTWPVEVQTAESVNATHIRADVNPKSLALSVLGGKPVADKQTLLAPTTASALTQIASEINQAPRSAKMVIDDNWAKEFDPGQLGQALDLYQLKSNLLANLSATVDLPVLISHPETSLNETNALGINELVSEGVSDFSGSTKSRIVNVQVGRSRFDGVIIKPGEEFSFNKYLGEVDGKHGFLPELVIKQTGVVAEFGGGLCQVSSTAFRAAMNAGLNITARRNHSFAVHYYSPQGTDATIYPGVQDMKFINDTPASILVWTRIDLEHKKLYFDFYGTKDDRQVAFDGPYQYDKKANGAMKATWTKKVTLNGVTTEQVFNSIYRPPADFQTVTQPATPNPDATPTPGNTPTPTEPAPAPTPPPPAIQN